MVKKLGVNHVKGMLLFGPPGTGKTLIARQIGKMLNGKEPKVVNGPEVLSKYVGQSEENIRNLFADAGAQAAAARTERGVRPFTPRMPHIPRRRPPGWPFARLRGPRQREPADVKR